MTDDNQVLLYRVTKRSPERQAFQAIRSDILQFMELGIADSVKIQAQNGVWRIEFVFNTHDSGYIPYSVKMSEYDFLILPDKDSDLQAYSVPAEEFALSYEEV